MATDNPKVSAYVPQALKTRLKEFRDDRDNISESQAVTVILAEYFQMTEVLGRSPEGVVGGVTLARMEELENRLRELELVVEWMRSDSNRSATEVAKPAHIRPPARKHNQLTIFDSLGTEEKNEKTLPM